VQDGLDTMVAESGPHHGGVPNVGLDEGNPTRERVEVPGGEIVHDDDLVPGPEEHADHVRSDVSGSPRDADVHRAGVSHDFCEFALIRARAFAPGFAWPARLAYGPSVKKFLGFLLFLVLAEDSGCRYAEKVGAPLGWVNPFLLEPLPIKLRLFDLILLGILITAPSKGVLSRPMKSALLTLVGGTIVCFAWGVFHGGDFRHASWQTYLILSSVLAAFTVAATFRTPADFVELGKWLMGVALYRALMCWVAYLTYGKASVGESGAYLTTHDDTIVWVVGIMALLINSLDSKSTLGTLRNFGLMLFFVGAIQFNSRRLAWVSLAMGVSALYFLFPKGKAKTRVNRFLMATAPLLLLYVIVGWGRGSLIFLPLRSFASVSTQEDASTLARNAENLGLIATANSWGFLFGSGWGKPYVCLTTKYDISGAFELWQYVPHNSILGLLAFTGIFGAAIFWTTVSTGVFLNVRVARLAKDPVARTVAILGASQVVVCGNQLYGDMGIFFFKPMYFLAVSYAIALRLPGATGLLEPAKTAARER
jgi:hypothetical protein